MTDRYLRLPHHWRNHTLAIVVTAVLFLTTCFGLLHVIPQNHRVRETDFTFRDKILNEHEIAHIFWLVILHDIVTAN